MSWLVITWSMVAAACLTLAVGQLVIWCLQRERLANLLLAIMSAAAAVNAILELQLLHATSIETYHVFLRWENGAIYVLLVSMVWAVRAHFETGRLWLAWLITGMWTVAVVINFTATHNLVFDEITELVRSPTWGGDYYINAVGTNNPWVQLADVTSLVIIAYVVDASVSLWRLGKRRRATVVGGGITFFMLAGGVEAVLVDSGVLQLPYMISIAFLFIVGAMNFELVTEVVRAAGLSREVEANEQRWSQLLHDVNLAVIGADLDGRINYLNPYILGVTGREGEALFGSPLFDLVVADEVESLRGHLEAASVRGPRPHSEWTIKCHPEGERRFSWSSVPQRDVDGKIVGIIAVGEDITPRLRAEEAERSLSGRILTAHEEERSRLARELHDDITQRLARLAIDAAASEKSLGQQPEADAVHGLRQALIVLSEDVHALAYRLHPSILEDLGLPVALRAECDRIVREGALTVHFRLRDVPSEIPRPVALSLFRIAQEALRNAVRHAHAQRVDVLLASSEEGLQLTIHDDGTGFNPEAARSSPSLGLASMRERVRLHRGELDIDSAPDDGTTVVAWIPWPPTTP